MMLDWSLPLAIATGSLAAAAFWAIWQNYRFRRQERKERLLNEIIEWANDVNTQINNFALLSANPLDTLGNLSRVSLGLSNTGKYMKSIAENVLKNETLKKSISNTGNAISVYGASLSYLADGVEGGEFLMMDMTKKQKHKYTKELDVALASYKKDMDMKDIFKIAAKLEENMRDNAIKTLDICVQLKADLLA